MFPLIALTQICELWTLGKFTANILNPCLVMAQSNLWFTHLAIAWIYCMNRFFHCNGNRWTHRMWKWKKRRCLWTRKETMALDVKTKCIFFQARTLHTIDDFLSLRLKTHTWNPTFSLMKLEMILKTLLPSILPGMYNYYHKNVNK